MKRLYVTTKEVWGGQALDHNGKPLVHHVKRLLVPTLDAHGNWVVSDEVIYDEIPFRHIDLFHTAAHGSHYIDLDDKHILMAADVEHSEHCAEIWHGHPEVARLPHPIYEGKVTLHEALTVSDHAPKRFKQHHMDALLGHTHLGVTHSDTVLTLSKKSSALHKGVKISSFI